MKIYVSEDASLTGKLLEALFTDSALQSKYCHVSSWKTTALATRTCT